MKYSKALGSLTLMVLSMCMNEVAQIPANVDSSVDFCELQERPGMFLDKAFEARADYFVGLEMGWLKGVDTCEKIARPKAILYLFDKGFEKATKKSAYKRFQRRLK